MRLELLLKLYFAVPGDGGFMRGLLKGFRKRALATLAELEGYRRNLSSIPDQHANHPSILAVIRLGIRMYRVFARWALETDRLFMKDKPGQ